MIKALTAKELKDWVDIAEKLHEEMGIPGVFNRRHFLASWESIIKAKRGAIFARLTDEKPREAIGIVFYEDPLTSNKTAATAFWLMPKDSSGLATGHLQTEVVKFCKHYGAKRLYLSLPMRFHTPEAGEMLRKLGYGADSIQFEKDI